MSKNIPKKSVARIDPFQEGVLCFVVRRKYAGKGKRVLILHEANSKEFSFGASNTWTSDKLKRRR